MADERCLLTERGRASYVGGVVKVFDGDYNKFTCTVSTKEIMSMPKTKKLLDVVGGCVRKNIAALDDLNSDAKTISEGVAVMCKESMDHLVTFFLLKKRSTLEFNKIIRKKVKQELVRKILPYVLKWRSMDKKVGSKAIPLDEKDFPNSIYIEVLSIL